MNPRVFKHDGNDLAVPDLEKLEVAFWENIARQDEVPLRVSGEPGLSRSRGRRSPEYFPQHAESSR